MGFYFGGLGLSDKWAFDPMGHFRVLDWQRTINSFILPKTLLSVNCSFTVERLVNLCKQRTLIFLVIFLGRDTAPPATVPPQRPWTTRRPGTQTACLHECTAIILRRGSHSGIYTYPNFVFFVFLNIGFIFICANKFLVPKMFFLLLITQQASNKRHVRGNHCSAFLQFK